MTDNDPLRSPIGVDHPARNSWMVDLRRSVVQTLRKTGLLGPARRLLATFGAIEEPVHGHGLVMDLLERVPDPTGMTLIEVGSTRENLPGQGSTAILAEYAAKHGMRFTTVDMDPSISARARSTVSKWNPEFNAVNAKGEAFLATLEHPVEFVYLDAFDIDHGEHSLQRRERYRSILSTEISNAGAAQMHLECAWSLVDIVSGFVVIDDTWRVGDAWDGKGASAVPFLLAEGFEIAAIGFGSVALAPAEHC